MAKEKAIGGTSKREVTADMLKADPEDKGFSRYRWICPNCGSKDNSQITTKFSPPCWFRPCKKCQVEILIFNPRIYQ